MRLGAVRDVVLARVPIEAHRALGQTCKALRRLVYSDDLPSCGRHSDARNVVYWSWRSQWMIILKDRDPITMLVEAIL